jgi:hypothetical protein
MEIRKSRRRIKNPTDSACCACPCCPAFVVGFSIACVASLGFTSHGMWAFRKIEHPKNLQCSLFKVEV